ncbi:nucleoside triphosphate pyrophosphohydrolase family protein [Candidatus Saccharibacteria bacterium]|nr:nucleoside triphosphate pyrophosphohydrolase family protein [Candidatus Saccharibacteria bacterium]
MDFDKYQKDAALYDRFTETEGMMAPGMLEKVLGLTGEAGEVADKVKKVIRDKNGELSEEDREGIAKELGDVLWYIAGISRYLGLPMSEVAKKNIAKLDSRMKRGKIGGEGDNR